MEGDIAHGYARMSVTEHRERSMTRTARLIPLLIVAACVREGDTRADTLTATKLETASGTVSRSVDTTSITIPGRDPEDGQWLRPAKDYASTRFSELDQINATNAASLKPAWTF